MFKNMKIAITDDVHLRSVCEVLESIGYEQEFETSAKQFARTVSTCVGGLYGVFSYEAWVYDTTLTDLLRIRDEMVKEGAIK